MRFKPLVTTEISTGLDKPVIPLDRFDFRDTIEEITDYILADCGGCIP